ncbi:MAG TPA: twin-arginine translocase subunit TatC, partial [Richelia sp.]|nr:twin-arginine translocase subunit TatC [Richelia sp.]
MPLSKDADTLVDIEEDSFLADNDSLDELPGNVEMSLFEHLEELRMRMFYALVATVIAAIGCFIIVKPIVQLLEVPAKGVKFLQ